MTDFPSTDFHCGRCGTLLDGDTDEPVAARELRIEVERLRAAVAIVEAAQLRGDVPTSVIRDIRVALNAS